ncbi:MAG: hypothetical protein COB53_01490 [Elusimicrobia bacterium]|nr:MAG: hypothetical protein COB53_01490 [Elusimicrobiota bacterium]
MWKDIEARVKGRLGNTEPLTDNLKELFQERPFEGKKLARIRGSLYDLLIDGLTLDLEKMAVDAWRIKTAAMFWAEARRRLGTTMPMEIDYPSMVIREACCPACTAHFAGTSFETSADRGDNLESVILQMGGNSGRA